jgi:2,3-dimethylmalate lyase
VFAITYRKTATSASAARWAHHCGRARVRRPAHRIPVIGDADTGFGNVVNVVRTVREYERAGAAAIHIEDQLTPKRPAYIGDFEGAFVSRQEMVDKIRAACDARTDPEFVIVARCDVADDDERTERLVACIEAGADVAWLNARGAEALRAQRRALAAKPALGVLPGRMTTREYQDIGVNLAIIPGALQIAALAAQEALLRNVIEHGSARAYLQSAAGNAAMSTFYNSQGTAEVQAIESRFGGSPTDHE